MGPKENLDEDSTMSSAHFTSDLVARHIRGRE